jgi:hypothetical protein
MSWQDGRWVSAGELSIKISSKSNEVSDENPRIFESVTPDVLIGGPVSVSPGFPIEAFGNDGL